MPISVWGFQAPWMLLAGLALAIPIAIHLLSKSKGKKVFFGDIRLIPNSTPVRMTQIRLVEPLLLLLRLLLLMISVLLLAKIYWIQDDQIEETIALVTPDWLHNASDEQKQTLINRFKEEGSTHHSKNNENPPHYKKVLLLDKDHITPNNHLILTVQGIANWPANMSNDAEAISINNTWSLVENMTKTLSNDTHFEVYTTNAAKEFFGDKVSARANVAWNILSEDENLNDLSDKAREQFAAINLVIIGNQMSNDSSNKVVKALSLIQRYSMEKLSVKIYENLQEFLDVDTKKKIDWIINLKPIKTTKTQEQALIDRLAVRSRLVIIEPMTSQNVANSNIFLFTNERAEESTDQNFHSKTFNNGTFNLRQKKILEGEIYKLDETTANWTTLINQPQFPQQLLSLLLHDKNSTLSLLIGRLSHEQISSAVVVTNLLPEKEQLAFSTARFIKQKIANFSLNQVWLMWIFLLWIAERLLSELSIKGKQRLDPLSNGNAVK